MSASYGADRGHEVSDYRHVEHDDEDGADYAPQGASTVRWVRAAVAVAVVATGVVVALPYLLNWLAPVPPALQNPVRIQPAPRATLRGAGARPDGGSRARGSSFF